MKGKPKEKHPYFWLLGAGGPGNRRRRTSDEVLRRRMLIGLKHKAALENIPFNLSLDDISVPQKCPVFGHRLRRNLGKHGGTWWSPSIDRRIPKKGYVSGNVHVISLKANSIKGADSLAKLEKRLKRDSLYVANLRKVVRYLRKINT